MIPIIQDYINSSHIGLTLLENFERNYSLELPDNMLSCYAHGNTAKVEVFMSYCPNEHGRAKVLSIVGDVFGRDGWVSMAQTSYGDHHFNWEKVIDDVRIIVHKAEPMPKYEKCAVPPQKFPVLLEDREFYNNDENFEG